MVIAEVTAASCDVSAFRPRECIALTFPASPIDAYPAGTGGVAGGENCAARLRFPSAAREPDRAQASVPRELRMTRVSGGVFTSFAFDRNGDMTPAPFAILRITGGRGTPGLAPDFRGATIDPTVRPPVSLLHDDRAGPPLAATPAATSTR